MAAIANAKTTTAELASEHIDWTKRQIFGEGTEVSDASRVDNSYEISRSLARGTAAPLKELEKAYFKPIAMGDNRPKNDPSASQQRSKSIAGVVRGVTDDFVRVSGKISDREEELLLPMALINEQLRRIGTPITMSLDESDGYRRILVTERVVLSQEWHKNVDDILREIDAL